MNKVVTVISGGLDSVTLAHLVARQVKESQHLISFYYGQSARIRAGGFTVKAARLISSDLTCATARNLISDFIHS